MVVSVVKIDNNLSYWTETKTNSSGFLPISWDLFVNWSFNLEELVALWRIDFKKQKVFVLSKKSSKEKLDYPYPEFFHVHYQAKEVPQMPIRW